MKNHFINYDICRKCDHLIEDDKDRVCDLNNLKIFYEWKEGDYVYRISSQESFIENIDDKCPEMIAHFAMNRDKVMMNAMKYEEYVKN